MKIIEEMVKNLLQVDLDNYNKNNKLVDSVTIDE